jgi:hypothetical protein
MIDPALVESSSTHITVTNFIIDLDSSGMAIKRMSLLSLFGVLFSIPYLKNPNRVAGSGSVKTKPNFSTNNTCMYLVSKRESW